MALAKRSGYLSVLYTSRHKVAQNVYDSPSDHDGFGGGRGSVVHKTVLHRSHI